MQRHRSSAVPLTWLYGALIVYASLYPFVGWRVPGVGPLDFLALGWQRYWTWFDVVANLIGYLPLGSLLFVALIRSGRRAGVAAALACLGGAVLSLVLEVLQNYLPQRVASNLDLSLNVAGTALGVAIGAALHWRGGIARWQKMRDRWFVARSAGGLALLLLWPGGLLFPTAVPFGLGHVFGRVQQIVHELLEGTPMAAWTEGWALDGRAVTGVPLAAGALSSSAELAIIVLGLLAPCLIAITIAAPGWRRVVLVLGAALVGTATTTLSTALNFGPGHAFAWTTEQALMALAIGIGVAVLLSFVPRR
ncbi:MAG: VanZ family protein, partial [Caldimonas sp.]